MKEKRLNTVRLTTEFEADLRDGSLPFSEYPRPQLKRDSYLCLNGVWNFKIKRKKDIIYDGSITVPFCPESRLSGVAREIEDEDTMIYERTFVLDEAFMIDRLLIHFGACDQYAAVYINGAKAGENIGGYLPFSFDITEYTSAGENVIRVEAKDPLSPELPYGKQRKKRGGMWYTPVSGIWQTVWLESVADNYIESIRLTPDLCGVDIQIIGGESEKTLVFDGKEYKFSGDSYRLDVESPKHWTPDTPSIYEFELISGKDRVSSYFALRTVSIEKRGGIPLICLNGEPIFCHGVLDQGYFPDGIFLPASERGFEEDVIRMKSLGFNMLRKHIKLEPDVFYYYCDKYGMLVFQDMINSGKYSFIVDTALPTVFLKSGVEHKASKLRREHFEKTSRGIIELLYNHPSVIYYTVFNEGWGQYDADRLYREFKALDGTRIYDTASGWFRPKESDVKSEHVYFKPIKLKSDTDKPLVLSEFGGYACKIEGHSFNPEKTYGYKFFKDMKELEDALVSLYETEVADAVMGGLCAAVLTQLSDVEDETNGLLTYDRRVVKADRERMKQMADSLFRVFGEQLRQDFDS